jgi:hypothetical protein
MLGLVSIVSAFIMPFLYHLLLICTKNTDEPITIYVIRLYASFLIPATLN